MYGNNNSMFKSIEMEIDLSNIKAMILICKLIGGRMQSIFGFFLEILINSFKIVFQE